jgi:hypothetical protein
MPRVARSTLSRGLAAIRGSELPRKWATYVQRWGAVLLAVWFASNSFTRITSFFDQGFPIGIDARIYHRAVVAWLSGGNPWDAAVAGEGWSFHFAGTPATLLLMAPTGLIDETSFTALAIGISWAGAAWTLRRLGFPLWWLLFPPLAEALFSANPQIVVLAMLVANRSIASAFAAVLKVYAFIPLVGELRWRQIAVAAGFYLGSVLVAPGLWRDYASAFGYIAARIDFETQHGGSAFFFSGLLGIAVFAVLILALRDRRAAGWLTVPALWPSSQFHYSTMALPVMSPLLAVFLAIPIARIAPVAIVLEVGRIVVVPWITRHRVSGRSATFEAGESRTVAGEVNPATQEAAEPPLP